MKRIAFTTLGCKTNHYDSDVMAAACARAGLRVVPSSSKADVHVINTCTVTAAADTRGRNIVRSIIRRDPKAKVVVCGCSSEVDAETYAGIEGVEHVLGVRAADGLMDILRSEEKGERDVLNQNRARAFLKIQDGCDDRCAYCIVPFARGASRSVSEGKIIDDVENLSNSGFNEIILTGVHVGRYGEDLKPRNSFTELMSRLLAASNGVRFRISSLDPDDIDERFTELFSDKRVCRHLHLSLQSGSDAVLRMMSRSAGVRRYAAAVAKIAEKISGISIGADIITGFPGETNELFEETMNFVKDMPFAYLHVFPYSPRKGTKAVSMKDQVPVTTRKERAKELLEISATKRAAFYESQIGKRLDVIIVSKEPDNKGLVKGISDNYLPVMIRSKDLQYRGRYEAVISRAGTERVYGNIA